jgi:hypothetical protein
LSLALIVSFLSIFSQLGIDTLNKTQISFT